MAKDGSARSEPCPEERPPGIPEDPRLAALLFERAPDAQFLVNPGGEIVAANSQAEAMFGYSRQELVGGKVEMLIPDRFNHGHVSHRSRYQEAPRSRLMGSGMELLGRRRDGSEIPLDIMLAPLETGHGPLVLAVARDVSERKRMEDDARRVRETNLKELHHRIKNNLQVVSSLLYLQSTRTGDPGLSEILNESRNRVISIALVHEKLYRSSDLGSVDMTEYVNELVRELFRAYGAQSERIELQVEVEDIHMGPDTAIPCALIVNELISNALKHAFPDGGKGRILLRLARAGDGRYELLIRDDGIGLPLASDWTSSPSLGLRLVRDLARQLEGEIESRPGPGTAFRLLFREARYHERV
jgi:PAS domain S-box-containing protein